MRNKKLITVALAATMFFTLTAFTPATAVPNVDIGTRIVCSDPYFYGHRCGNLIDTRKSDWVKTSSWCTSTGVTGYYTFERTIEDYCPICGKVHRTKTEYWTVPFYFWGLVYEKPPVD